MFKADATKQIKTYMHGHIVKLTNKLWGQVRVIGNMCIHFLVG